MASVNAPKRVKNASKKNKKAWRKNTDMDDVEEFLEDRRLEERLGGDFCEKSDAELFVVDNKSTEETLDSKPEGIRAAKKRRAAEKPLRGLQHLEIAGGAPDPKKGRNRRKTPLERRNPLLVLREQRLRNSGVIKAKEAMGIKHRNDASLKKKAQSLERSTRRRTKFDFDLWGEQEKSGIHGDMETQGVDPEWIGSGTLQHTLKNTGCPRNKVPSDFYAKPSDLPAVQVPDAGASYNPAYNDHQNLLFKAAMVEINKEKARRKVDYHTTRMFPCKSEAPNERTWLEEMSEGLNGAPEAVEEGQEEVDDQGQVSLAGRSAPKPKTEKQRKKLKRLKNSEQNVKGKRVEKRKDHDLLRLRSMRKEIRAMEEASQIKMMKKEAKNRAKRTQPAQLGAAKYEDPELDVLLSDELPGSLRVLRPEGSLLEDRFKSLQRRNVIETRIKHKIVKNRRKRKKVEKRSYKMGFSFEK